MPSNNFFYLPVLEDYLTMKVSLIIFFNKTFVNCALCHLDSLS